MTDWCTLHPWMTFLIALAVVPSISVVIHSGRRSGPASPSAAEATQTIARAPGIVASGPEFKNAKLLVRSLLIASRVEVPDLTVAKIVHAVAGSLGVSIGYEPISVRGAKS